MKKTGDRIIRRISLLLLLIIFNSFSVHASDVSDKFSQKFNALRPPENSSVHSDYLFEQIALGSEYTIIMLENLGRNNEMVNRKMDAIIERLDTLIDQNREIIKLLQEKKSKILKD